MRLIDADALKESWKKNIENEGATLALLSALFKSVEDAPTIDAVSVVRCKECVHWCYNCKGDFDIEYGDCEQWADVWNDHVPETTGECYCSWGERKESE